MHSTKRTFSDYSPLQTGKKVCRDITSLLSPLQDVWKYRTVWYNQHQHNPLEHYNVAQKLQRGVTDYLECFVDIEEYRKYIQSLVDDGVYIISIISVFSSQPSDPLNAMSSMQPPYSIYIHVADANHSPLARDSLGGTQEEGKV
jgi:hypothetical protein